MHLNAHMNLEGTFTVDVFNRDGTKKYSIGPKKNFITSTGLSYVSQFAIADCFRYVSFGTSNIANTINGNNGWGTSYLGNRIHQLSYIGGRDRISDPGHINSQYLEAGFTEYISGVTLSRSWRVPSGLNSFFDADYTFEEVMLSPGKGYEVGISQTPFEDGRQLDTTAGDLISANFIQVNGAAWTTNQWVGFIVDITDSSLSIAPQRRRVSSNTTNRLNFSSSIDTSAGNNYAYDIHNIFQLCHCADAEYDIDDLYRGGSDCGSSVSYYSGTAHRDICAASGAFTRMVQTIAVAQDDYMIFNYDLHVSFETGKYPFKLVVSNSRGALQNLSLWKGITGVHQLVHHGIKMISPGTVVSDAPWGGPITQDDSAYWTADSDFGESFNGPWGSPLEPSALGIRLTAYLTNDNLQFFANSVDGGAYTAGVAGFSGTSGLMAWRQTPYDTPPNGYHFNIRRDNVGGATPYWPLPTDYTISTNDPNTDFAYRVQSMVPTFDTSVVYPAFANPAVRTRTVTRSFQFAGREDLSFSNDSTVGSEHKGAQVRGIVLGYIDPAVDTDYVIPYLDCLFMDSGVGVAGPKQNYRLLPQKDAPSVGQYTTGNVIGVPGSASYWSYLEADAKLTFTFTETWGSPCSASVVGC